MSFLTDYEEIDWGYVAFGGNPKRRKITGKGTKDETSGTPKSFINRVENLMNLRVKVIRCDNGTEFKNKEMNQFYEVKGIMRRYSVARTPQQNKVAKRRNKTLIKAARTMLADSKLPPAIRFLKPFGCPVTIFNTIDHLGKFNRKADEGFFVGYLLNSSGPNCLFDIDALTKTMNYKPVVVQSNDFSSTKASNDAGKEKEPDRDYILLPLWTADSPFSSTSKSSQDTEFQPSNDGEDDTTNSTNRVNNVTSYINATSSSGVNVVGTNISTGLPLDPNIPSLEDIDIFEDSYDDKYVFGVEADFHNLDSTFQVSPIPTTRIHKDQPLEQVIGDLHSAPRTRRMLKNLEEHGLVGTVIPRTDNKDL
uniref:Integrase catalytic domain-containing protein n=1 Tax=Tanacetum cinerariifolium TaxID=118510 RepID=A0A6L2NYF3_TANCI|nr:hypothetical protein [Tanacetum cinerariifolium]